MINYKRPCQYNHAFYISFTKDYTHNTFSLHFDIPYKGNRFKDNPNYRYGEKLGYLIDN